MEDAKNAASKRYEPYRNATAQHAHRTKKMCTPRHMV